MEIISRIEALEKGLRFYFTGKPCVKGHISQRYTNNRNCCECSREYLSYEEKKEYNQKYHQENKNRTLSKQREYHQKNRIDILMRKKKYQQEKPEVHRVINAKRRASKRNATVTWADKVKISKIYERCEFINRDVNEPHHVDHIVPLQSPLVCGLHNEFNLQILTAKENLSKCNRIWPDMPDDIEEALKFYYG
jgi:hypothetical protein